MTSPSSVFNSAGKVSCGQSVSVPNGYFNLPSTASWWTFARYDYARVQFSCSVGSHVGWMGTAYLDNSELPSSGIQTMGYPSRWWCPSGALGGAADCPAALGGQGASQRGGAPTSWAKLFRSSGGVQQGDSESAYTMKFLNDWTSGQSGGPLTHYFINSNGWEGHHILGVVSNNQGGTSPVNRANRRWSAVYSHLYP